MSRSPRPGPEIAATPELRIDPLTGVRTIVAGARADRPGGGFSAPARPAIDHESDPFLAGHERQTPPELYALGGSDRSPDTPGWTVRVVPNLYPALVPPEQVADASRRTEVEPPAALTDPLAAGRGEPEFFRRSPATGAHEVIVNAPDPVASLVDLEDHQVAAAMEVWRQRMRFHSDAAYVHVSVNEGREAGASLPHTHAQLYALANVPAAIARERERFTAYAERTDGRNLLGDLLQEEVKLGERVVATSADAVAICPFASRVPFQLQIVPRRPRASFEDEGPLAAGLLHEILGRLADALGGAPPLNLWVRTAPRGADHFCWRLEIVPRLTRLAGLELGAGLNLNVLAPERAAAILRESSPSGMGVIGAEAPGGGG